MIWLLPLIVIGGLFYPVLGYMVIAMMVFLLSLSFFKKRYWCWNLCPRGAFLDLIIGPLSRNKKIPGVFFKRKFRLVVLIVLMASLLVRVSLASGPAAVGLIFVTMCLVSTIIASVLGLFFSKRAWCAACPMGFLQEEIHNLNKS